MLPKALTQSRVAWPWWRFALSALSSLALALSLYLAWHHLMGGSVIGCAGGSACDQVLSTRWSSVGGRLPVSGLAVGAYLAMLVASFFIGPATPMPDRRLAWGALLVLAGATAGSAFWFTFAQKWIVGAFCPYCTATHITALLLAALVLWRAARPSDAPPPAAATPVIRPRPAIGLAFAGLGLAGILAAAQLTFTPPPVYRDGASQNTVAALDPHAVPLVGSPDAPYVVTLFFDYKCPHCQQVHSLLEEAVRRYHGKLAVVLCPTPLNTHCNPYVPQDIDAFKDSCELARLSLAVWVARREAFPAFDRWMFTPEADDAWHPRTLEAARAEAIELLGESQFNAARDDPWINRYLQTSIGMYGQTIGQGGNAVPKLVFGTRWVTPQPNSADDLLSILRDSLSLPAP